MWDPIINNGFANRYIFSGIIFSGIAFSLSIDGVPARSEFCDSSFRKLTDPTLLSSELREKSICVSCLLNRGACFNGLDEYLFIQLNWRSFFFKSHVLLIPLSHLLLIDFEVEMFAHLVFIKVRSDQNFQDTHIEFLDIGL